jgi:hypothetical protein
MREDLVLLMLDRSEYADTRLATALELVEWKEGRARLALEEFLHMGFFTESPMHNPQDVRAKAAEALGKLGDAGSIPALAKLIDDATLLSEGDEAVNDAVLRALEGLAGRKFEGDKPTRISAWKEFLSR